MSFLKAVFFTLPLMAIAAIGLSYFLSTQANQPRAEDVLQKVETAITAADANAAVLKEINGKLDEIERNLAIIAAKPQTSP